VLEPEMQEDECVRDKYIFLRNADKKTDRGKEGIGEAGKDGRNIGKADKKTMQVIKPVAKAAV